jgi:hypothetical protein
MLLVAACDDGSGEPSSMAAAVQRTARPVTLVRLDAEPAGAQCASGGTSVNAGLDLNGDGSLSASETTSTSYVCNAVAGVPGQAGTSTLVATLSEPAGAHCANGGAQIQAGKDANANGVLDASEVSSLSYVCNAADGATGGTGATGGIGATGVAGVAGVAGAPGLTSLLIATAEPAGLNCANGGSKVSAGLDTNANGVLDPSEITAGSYLCNGAPGAGIVWQDTAAAAVQGQSNVGYVADNASVPVVVTLPASPAVGDVIWVSGAGAAGWSIAQNAGQSIKTSNIPGGGTLKQLGWTEQDGAGFHAWRAIASSSDGSHLAAVDGNFIYTSSDSGVTWVTQGGAGQANWRAIASSVDGSHLAVVDGVTVSTSADFGVTWVTQTGLSSGIYDLVASSADGSHLVTADENFGYISTSADYGVTWTVQTGAGQNFWLTIALSADGSHLAAGVNSPFDYVYTSSDFGVTWTQQASVGQGWWYAIASDTSGSNLLAADHNPGYLYTSSDGGATWTQQLGSGMHQWVAVSSSSDGTQLAAADAVGLLYVSSDSGATWSPQSGPGQNSWTGLASNASGTRLAVASSGGYIFTGHYAYATTVGAAGSLGGAQYDAIQLQYVGSGVFIVLSFTAQSGQFSIN